MCFLRCHGLAIPGESTRFFKNDVVADFLFKTTGSLFSNIYGPTFFMETIICVIFPDALMQRHAITYAL